MKYRIRHPQPGLAPPQMLSDCHPPHRQKAVLFIFLLAKYAATALRADTAAIPLFQMPR